MDERKKQRALLALKWDAKYIRQSRGEPTGNAFMAEIESLDEDFERALEDFNIHGETLLDIGTGVGWQAIQLARKGFRVTAVDVSRFCLAKARKNAALSGVTIQFLTDDILRTSLTETFDVLVDRGCFTGLPDDFLSEYASQISRLVSPDGYFLLKIAQEHESRLSHLAEKFKIARQLESFYLGPENQRWGATFLLLRPVP